MMGWGEAARPLNWKIWSLPLPIDDLNWASRSTSSHILQFGTAKLDKVKYALKYILIYTPVYAVYAELLLHSHPSQKSVY